MRDFKHSAVPNWLRPRKSRWANMPIAIAGDCDRRGGQAARDSLRARANCRSTPDRGPRAHASPKTGANASTRWCCTNQVTSITFSTLTFPQNCRIYPQGQAGLWFELTSTAWPWSSNLMDRHGIEGWHLDEKKPAMVPSVDAPAGRHEAGRRYRRVTSSWPTGAAASQNRPDIPTCRNFAERPALQPIPGAARGRARRVLVPRRQQRAMTSEELSLGPAQRSLLVQRVDPDPSCRAEARSAYEHL